jgi:transketolase
MNHKNLKLMANAIRFLSLDAVERANSGHPGMPMGMADVATSLFSNFLKFDPKNPNWPNRDRFILSAGHGSMLLYSLLYLTGYKDITLGDIKNFRQLGSKTAGHPEHGILDGVETTTGPLGQGLANAVGMAISERMLNARDSKINHHTYVIVGDGCLMEGISQEAISLAGHLRLNKLIVLFDDNKISIDGPTSLTISDDVLASFKACGWNACSIDGHNYQEIEDALKNAQNSDKPSLIACSTIIGYGSPNKGGTEHCHGAALGEKEVLEVRKNLNWPYCAFEIPDDILKLWRNLGCSNTEKQRDAKEISCNLDALKAKFVAELPQMSTRKASGMVLEKLSQMMPNLLGGSADLTGSNVTNSANLKAIKAGDFAGRYIYYGVREHAMAAIMNGIALYKAFLPYAGTFLVFSDYCRPAIRLSCLMELQVFYVMTHDSIGLGEDGPTHQAVEHLASLRAMPNLYVFRPACPVETAECYEVALRLTKSPSLFSLTRQDVPALRSDIKENLSQYGAYIIGEYQGDLRVTIFATGSEVSIALLAQKELHAQNIGTRVISMPCLELFDQQDKSYQDKLLNNDSLKVAIEAGVKQSWEKYLGKEGIFIGMESFGSSAPAHELYQYYGITKENVINQILTLLSS